MITKPIYLSEVAKDDLADALLNYEQQFAEQAIDGCLNALAKAYKQIGKFPKTGSPKAGNDLNLPRLRSWPLSKYPYLSTQKTTIKLTPGVYCIKRGILKNP